MTAVKKFLSWTRKWIYRWRSRRHYLWGLLHRYYGNAQGDTQEYEAAIDDFTQALNLDPNFAQAYLDRGILYWREFDHPRKAIQDLNKALSIKPTLYEALFNRGIAYQELHEYQLALRDYRTYLENGDHPHWREYAQKMIEELSEWELQEETG